MNRSILTIFLFFLLPSSLIAQVKLPELISDGMVLQRDTEVTIWGWASPGEEVSVHFDGEEHQTTTDEDGDWQVQLSGLQAGGPYTMQIMASDTVGISDILVGDVWVASGQSNMELSMYRVSPLYREEINTASYPEIRYFEVPKQYDFKEARKSLESGQWESATPENIERFSAAAYFFAKSVYERYEVPVGIILTALGGSPAEAWMSEEALKEFPEHYNEAQRFKNDQLIEEIEREDRERSRAWYQELQHKDQGYENPDQPWYDATTDYSEWHSMEIPGYWADEPPGRVNGVVWFQRTINIPASLAGKPAHLELGRIVDADSVFVNGTFVGTTSYQYPPRWYEIPEGLLSEGENNFVIRVINSSGRGGFIPDKPYELIIDNDTLDLTGEWNYQLGAEMEPLASQTFIRWKPLGLYNAMISPLLNYTISGVIWYQGESNTGRPAEYRELFPAMIADWRNQWNQGDFPFLFVQLANFMEPKDQPAESNWAELRDAQLQALSVPNTGMAVAIDLGEWNDIHPLNKKDVGERLAAAAFKIAYDEDIVHSGPIYDTLSVQGDRIIVSFQHADSGLEIEGEKLQGFEIAGNDKKYRWAHTSIEGNEVVAWHPEIESPVYVRYGWADNPVQANLYNKEGFPASPFQSSICK